MNAVEVPPRLYFSDAKVSFVFPEGWKMDPRFPFGPMFWKEVSGGTASIACTVSSPLPQLRAAEDLSFVELKSLVSGSLKKANPSAEILAEEELTLADHHYFLVTWQPEGGTRFVSAYFFHENRLYSVSLDAPRSTIDTLKPDFLTWLKSTQRLSRMDTGALAQPARGGVWVHQTSGGRVVIPEEWLIAAATDQVVGATRREDGKESYWTATVSPEPMKTPELSQTDKDELRASLEKKGYVILNSKEDTLSSFPAFIVNYQGRRSGVPVKGRDILLQTSKARWLFSFEAPYALFTKYTASELLPFLNDVRLF